MKKFILSVAIIVGFAGYIMFQRGSADSHVVTPPTLLQTNPSSDTANSSASTDNSSVPAGNAPDTTSSQTNSSPAPTPTPAPSPAPASAPKAAPAPKPAQGQYRNGTFTGPVADAYYGPLQVAVTIQGGKITDVRFLQYPSDRSTSREINGQAMPYFKQEALVAQNANVDVVSGATASSGAFQESLAGALAQAKS